MITDAELDLLVDSPCRYCGGEKNHRLCGQGPDGVGYAICCHNCFAAGPVGPTVSEAAAYWAGIKMPAAAPGCAVPETDEKKHQKRSCPDDCELLEMMNRILGVWVSCPSPRDPDEDIGHVLKQAKDLLEHFEGPMCECCGDWPKNVCTHCHDFLNEEREEAIAAQEQAEEELANLRTGIKALARVAAKEPDGDQILKYWLYSADTQCQCKACTMLRHARALTDGE